MLRSAPAHRLGRLGGCSPLRPPQTACVYFDRYRVCRRRVWQKKANSNRRAFQPNRPRLSRYYSHTGRDYASATVARIRAASAKLFTFFSHTLLFIVLFFKKQGVF